MVVLPTSNTASSQVIRVAVYLTLAPSPSRTALSQVTRTAACGIVAHSASRAALFRIILPISTVGGYLIITALSQSKIAQSQAIRLPIVVAAYLTRAALNRAVTLQSLTALSQAIAPIGVVAYPITPSATTITTPPSPVPVSSLLTIA